MRLRSSVLSAVIVGAVIAVSGMRDIYKYMPFSIAAAIAYALLVLAGLVGFVLLKNRYSAVDRSFPAVIIGFTVLLVCTTLFLYPRADALKYEGRGSTGDDAIIESVRSFAEFSGLYYTTLYDGAPISPGPGWILLNAPFVLFHSYWLFAPVYLLAACFLSARYGPLRRGSLIFFCLCCISSLLFWDLLATGHDLLPLGFAFLICTHLVRRLSCSKKSGVAEPLLIGLFVGLVSTSRIVFVGIPLLYGVFLWQARRRIPFIFLIASLGTLLLFHGVFYHSSETYQPFHLFGKGGGILDGGYSYFAAFLTIVSAGLSLFVVRRGPAGWFWAFSLCVGVPLACIAFAELIAENFDFSQWEGANYFMPVLPVLFYAASKSSERKASSSGAVHGCSRPPGTVK